MQSGKFTVLHFKYERECKVTFDHSGNDNPTHKFTQISIKKQVCLGEKNNNTRNNFTKAKSAANAKEKVEFNAL